MKLDRNINPDNSGKYALLKMRRVNELLTSDSYSPITKSIVKGAIKALVDVGAVDFGSESPAKQFFVMRHGDRFTQYGLEGYRRAVLQLANTTEDVDLKFSLIEYADQLLGEAKKAEAAGVKIPD